MNQPITIGLLLKTILACGIIYVVGMVILIVIGLILFMHAMSGGYWPKWYWKLKQRKLKNGEKKNPIRLNL